MILSKNEGIMYYISLISETTGITEICKLYKYNLYVVRTNTKNCIRLYKIV